jgi:hypothetical protein
MPVTNQTAGGTQVNVPYGRGAAPRAPRVPSPTAGVTGGVNAARPRSPASGVTGGVNAARPNQPKGGISGTVNVNQPKPSPPANPAPQQTPAPYWDQQYGDQVAAINLSLTNKLAGYNQTWADQQLAAQRQQTQLDLAQPAQRQAMLNAAERGGYLTGGATGYNADQLAQNYIRQSGTIADQLQANQDAYSSGLLDTASQYGAGGTELAKANADLQDRALQYALTSGDISTKTGGGKKTNTGGGAGKTPPKLPPRPTGSSPRQRAAQKANQKQLRGNKYARTNAPPSAFL